MEIPNGTEEEKPRKAEPGDNTEKDLESRACSQDGIRPYAIDPAVEKRVVRKLDKHLIPLVMILCMSPEYLDVAAL